MASYLVVRIVLFSFIFSIYTIGFGSAMRTIAIIAILSLSACVSASTDAGCISYGIARGDAPDTPLPSGPWGDWIAKSLDARMTGTCR